MNNVCELLLYMYDTRRHDDIASRGLSPVASSVALFIYSIMLVIVAHSPR